MACAETVSGSELIVMRANLATNTTKVRAATRLWWIKGNGDLRREVQLGIYLVLPPRGELGVGGGERVLGH